jgi:hypothetical protein
MNSKTAQLTENGTEIVRLFARFALGASFLSAVADRFGLCKERILGRFRSFRGIHGRGDVSIPQFIDVSFAWAATVAETLFGLRPQVFSF